MKIAITGTTGLAEAIAGALQDHKIYTPRIDDILMNPEHGYWFDKTNPNYQFVAARLLLFALRKSLYGYYFDTPNLLEQK